MIKALVATVPGSGHVNPMLVVVRELVRQGYDVHWYTGRAFRSKIEAAGATFEPMTSSFDHGEMPIEEAFPQLRGLSGLNYFIEAWKAIFIGAAPKQMHDILTILDRFPADVLICDETHFGMGFAREKTRLPLVWISTSIYFFRSKDTAPIGLGLPPNSSWWGRLRNRMLYFVADHFLLKELKQYANQARVATGLPVIRQGALQNITPPPDLYLMGTVPEFEYPRNDLLPCTRFVGPFVPAPADNFLAPSWWGEMSKARAVVYVTEGTVNFTSNRLIGPVLEAMADEDVLVVVTTSGVPVEQLKLPHIPNNVRIEPFIPHANLLPYVDVMITNGGYGGVQMALTNGVPLVIAGATEEKPEVAAHVVYAGAGISLGKQNPTADKLKLAIRKVLRSPVYAARAKRLQAAYAQHDAPKEAVKLIQELLNKSAS